MLVGKVSRKYIMLFMHNNWFTYFVAVNYTGCIREIFLNISEILLAKKSHEILHHYVQTIIFYYLC